MFPRSSWVYLLTGASDICLWTLFILVSTGVPIADSIALPGRSESVSAASSIGTSGRPDSEFEEERGARGGDVRRTVGHLSSAIQHPMPSHFVVDTPAMAEMEDEVSGPDAKAQHAIVRRREEVAALLWLESRLRDLRKDLDEDVFRKKGSEAGSSAMAESTMMDTVKMIRDVGQEMHHYTAPVFQKVVEAELLSIAGRRRELLKQIAENGNLKPLYAERISDRPAGVDDAKPDEEEEKRIQQKSTHRSARTGQVVLALAIILSVSLLVMSHRAGVQS